jgi:predicted AlkP superfamily phosphohydrolase/phosphomutase
LARVAPITGLLLVVLAAGCGGEVPEHLRVTVVGIDGATWRVIDPLLERGELPTLAGLLARGVRGPLRSEVPLNSPPVWTTIATGVSRARHGIRAFATYSGELVSSRQRRRPALWLLASRAGLRSLVIGWWGTYPAEEIDGVVISERALKTREADLLALFPPGRPAEASHLTYPREALTWLGEALLAAPDLSAVKIEGVRVARTMRAEDRAVMRATLAAREREGPFDLEMILLRGVDPVSHYFWKFYEPEASAYTAGERPSPAQVERFGGVVEAHYRFVDDLLAEMLAEDDPARVVLLVSDHGFEAGHQRFHTKAILSGTHEGAAAIDGIFVAAGGPLRRGVAVAGLTIYDVAPTVLHLLGLPVPEDLEGRVAAAALDPDWLARHPPRYAAPDAGPPVALPRDLRAAEPESPVDEDLREELRALGYLE